MVSEVLCRVKRFVLACDSPIICPRLFAVIITPFMVKILVADKNMNAMPINPYSFILHCCLLLACCLATAQAQVAKPAKRVALLIGNAHYQQKGLTLNNPVKDTQLLAPVLEQKLGFSVRVEANLGVVDMDRVLAEFFRDAQGADVVLVYYAGHGMKGPEGTSFLLPVDVEIGHAKAWALERQAVAAARVRDQVEKIGARIGLLILDACRDGPARGGRSVDRGLSYVGGRERVLVAYAAEANRVAEDGKGENGPYARALATALLQNKPVLDQLDEVADAVEQETEQRQKPTREGNLRANAYLLPEKKPVPPKSPDQEEAAWQVCINGKTEQPCLAYERDFPNGPRIKQVQARIADFRKAASVLAQATQTPILTPVVKPGLQAGQVIKDCDVCPEMVVIPGGEFVMGDAKSDASDEKPAHRVKVGGFLLGKFEVTQGQWRALMKGNPSWFKDCGDNCPVENISWEDAQAYVKALSKKTGKQYRLPSEAEWEYAARAGSQAQWHFGDDEAQLGQYAWYGYDEGNADKKTHAVGGRQPNPFGLYDMHGNVWEWVEDCWHDNYRDAPTDGSAWLQNCQKEMRRGLRGGSWGNYSPAPLHAAGRYRGSHTLRGGNLGVRVARTPR